MISDDTPIRTNDVEVAAKVIDGEAIMINLTNGRYYSMQGIGSEVWEIITAGTTPARLAETLLSRFEADPRIVQRDAHGLVDLLIQENLAIVSENPVPIGEPEPPASPKRPYTSPHLDVYTEMGDLLALDPPLPGLDDIPWTGPEGHDKPGA